MPMTLRINLPIEPDLLEAIDAERGLIPRTVFIRAVLADRVLPVYRTEGDPRPETPRPDSL